MSAAEDAVLWEEVSPHVDEALDSLPDELRHMVIEHFPRQRTQAEIAADAGLEGLMFIAETSDRSVPCELNCQAFAHFAYHPEDPLRQFASRRLAPLVGGEDAARRRRRLVSWIRGRTPHLVRGV